jgi:hypothetical protein
MTTLHGKITVAELREDEDLFDELVDQTGLTARSVTIELNRHDDEANLEDIYDYVPDSLRNKKVVDARDDDDLKDEIAELATLDRAEVDEILEEAHGSKYVHTVIDFPWPQPEDDNADVDSEEMMVSEDSIKPSDRLFSPTDSGLLTVLLVSASPESQTRLRVDKEFRRIIERIRGSRYRDRLRLVQLQAACFDDLRTALMEHEPHILHFSGHGESNGSLVFEQRVEGSNVVSKKSFLRLLKALAGNLRLVVLNACHSQIIAAEVPPTIDLAMGMSNSITDSAAIDFAVALYEALAFNKPVQTAFDAATAGLDEDEVELPQLFPSHDPDRKRLRPLMNT